MNVLSLKSKKKLRVGCIGEADVRSPHRFWLEYTDRDTRTLKGRLDGERGQLISILDKSCTRCLRGSQVKMPWQ